MITTQTLIGTLIWLTPFIIYLLAFRDSSNMRIVWSIVMLLFTWVGLAVRCVYGFIAVNTDARLP